MAPSAPPKFRRLLAERSFLASIARPPVGEASTLHTAPSTSSAGSLRDRATTSSASSASALRASASTTSAPSASSSRDSASTTSATGYSSLASFPEDKASKPATIGRSSKRPIILSDSEDETPLPRLIKRNRSTSSKKQSDKSQPGYKELLAVYNGTKDDERYKPYWIKYSLEWHYERLWRMSRSPTQRIISSNKGWKDPNVLKAIGGNIRHKGPGWYLDAIADSDDPEYIKEYAGQAEDMDDRLRQHANDAKNPKKDSLHYRLVRSKPTRSSNYVVLGLYDDSECLDDKEEEQLFLNIGEQ
ncbi:Hypothetical protein D9617_3g022040 [Elsinoe fawcettii]|nr:Hypothetical protein D9617_3g022040 [Elsinoe fawcettii]